LSVRSRFAIQHKAMGRTATSAWSHTALWIILQSLSEVTHLADKANRRGLFSAWRGRIHGLASCLKWRP
jgi:hypothetical protein